MEPFIELKNIHKVFPGVYALKDVSLNVFPGEIHSLVGENGAGKSTLIKVMSGLHQPEHGTCYIRGIETKIDSPAKAIELGMGVVYQELNVVDSLNVAENVFFGRLPHTRIGRINWKKLYQDTQDILDRLGLEISPKRKAGYLSTAQKQMVDIARCISMDPQVIILDEPTSSLAPIEIDCALSVVRKLKSQGVGILYISHKLDEVFAVSDRITVLRDGEFVKCLQAKETNEHELISLMVGRQFEERYTHHCVNESEIALQVEGLSTDMVKDITFHVKKGEIVGFSGLMGAGRTELAKAICGVDRRVAGRITVYGEAILPDSMNKAVKAGIGFIPESRKEEGILPNMSVGANVSISSLSSYAKHGVINSKEERLANDELIHRLRVKTPGLKQLIVNLSGGNQQKVLIARWIAKKNLKVLIVDEPTRGIDVGAKSEIYALLEKMAAQGLAIVIMSSEMQEILGTCNRIYVMRAGRITGEFSREDATQEKLLTSAISCLLPSKECIS